VFQGISAGSDASRKRVLLLLWQYPVRGSAFCHTWGKVVNCRIFVK